MLGKKNKFLKYLFNNQLDKSNFVSNDGSFYNNKNTCKVIAFYLPQYHSFPENDKAFGRGFTEWSNTTKAVPQFYGHWQPHIPIDVGYYNLNNDSIMNRQVELAKQYGIYGFSFYYYWFSGHKVMEKPLESFLKNKNIDMPFFLFWANEDWSTLWDNGDDRKVIYKQEVSKKDAEPFMNDALKYMKDKRYIKINGKPVLIIYKLRNFPYKDITEFVIQIRLIAKQNGFKDLYILSPVQEDMNQAELKELQIKYNLDGFFEFFPMGLLHVLKTNKIHYINKKFDGQYRDINSYFSNKSYIYKTDANLFKGTFTNWDNTSRRAFQKPGPNIIQLHPNQYKCWLKDIINWTNTNKNNEERFVFVNAWNEWAEGAHLEPDQKYGYAYLNATKDALEGK